MTDEPLWIPEDQEIDPDVEAFYVQIGDGVARAVLGLIEMLGESPEAWRGAIHAHSGMANILSGYGVYCEDHKPPPELLVGIMEMLCQAFFDHPATEMMARFLGFLDEGGEEDGADNDVD